MSDITVGDLLDARGVTLDLEPDDLVLDAIVIARVAPAGAPSDAASVVLGNTAGMDWVTQRGLVEAGRMVIEDIARSDLFGEE